MNKLILSIRRKTTLLLDRLGTRFRNNFYIYAAIVFTLLAILDAFTTNYVIGMRNKSFDSMVKHRFHIDKPDSNIVIIDIDEKSLARMAPEYGRWPWPRQVFAELLEKIEVQNPKAVVFDILFSDPDILNDESDSYFNEVIATTKNTWFPMVRLPEASDSKSQLPVYRVPGTIAAGSADSSAKIAVILPFFKSIQESRRLGFNNIQPDGDGVNRAYPIRYHEHGYEISSLPLSVIHAIDSSFAAPDNILLNWRGKPFTFKYTSFSDIYEDMRKEHPVRPANEFTNKIVIIGATASGLSDIRVTAIDRQFPGVEILATAIDNLRARDWLYIPQIPLLYLLITLVILWMTAVGFYRRGKGGRLDTFYGFSQFLLLGIAYSAINIFNVYINLTGPVMFGFVYYSIARYYAFATSRALDYSFVNLQSNSNGTQGYLLALHFDLFTREEKLLGKLAAILIKQCKEKPSAEWLTGRQRGFWRIFENTLFLCWKADKTSSAHVDTIREEATALCKTLKRTLISKPMNNALPFDRLSISHAEGSIGSDKKNDWRMLMGAALIKPQEKQI